LSAPPARRGGRYAREADQAGETASVHLPRLYRRPALKRRLQIRMPFRVGSCNAVPCRPARDCALLRSLPANAVFHRIILSSICHQSAAGTRDDA